MSARAPVAFVQDHLVQRGGAERTLLSMLRAAPGAEIVTAFYRPAACYPEYSSERIRTMPLDRIGLLRAHHRATMPLLPFVFSHTRVDADVVVCCTSGWSQGVRTTGRKIVYFHALARWLYERDAYLKTSGRLPRATSAVLDRPLRRWDRRTVATAHRYVTQSTEMRRRLRDLYGVDAEIVPPPNVLDVRGPAQAVAGLDTGFFLCASRLLPYKNVDVVIEAFGALPAQRLVVAGDGPLLERLRRMAPTNVTFLGACEDAEMRWLYANCRAVVSAAVEPFGLTPVEAASFGRPAVTLAAGGFLDTVLDGQTGVHFATSEPRCVASAVERLLRTPFDSTTIELHAVQYGEPLFIERIQKIIDEERTG